MKTLAIGTVSWHRQDYGLCWIWAPKYVLGSEGMWSGPLVEEARVPLSAGATLSANHHQTSLGGDGVVTSGRVGSVKCRPSKARHFRRRKRGGLKVPSKRHRTNVARLASGRPYSARLASAKSAGVRYADVSDDDEKPKLSLEERLRLRSEQTIAKNSRLAGQMLGINSERRYEDGLVIRNPNADFLRPPAERGLPVYDFRGSRGGSGSSPTTSRRTNLGQQQQGSAADNEARQQPLRGKRRGKKSRG